MNPLDLLTAGTTLISKLLDFIPDPNKRAELQAQAQAQLMEMVKAQDAAQSTIDNTEAAGTGLFDKWRDGIGWAFAFALAYQYVLLPIGMWFSFMIGHPLPKPPIILDDNLWQLMAGMLGLSGLHAYQTVTKK